MPRNKITPTNFIATVYGELTPLNNSALSKARLKIFYKGLNRNGSYITDEVAETLIATLPGTPIVGYFDGDKDDFLGHEDKEKSRCYGFVPQDMNFSWEMSLDPDGVYRTYACTDIILWTGRYPVASKIVGKSHSMELNPNTVNGEWVETEDDFYFRFTQAEFIGLCVLGDDYEPCFEGSSFYELREQDSRASSSLQNDLKELFSLYKALDNAEKNLTGGQEMEEENKDLTPEVENNEEVTEVTEVAEGTEEVKDVVEETAETTEEVIEDSTNDPKSEAENQDFENEEKEEESPADNENEEEVEENEEDNVDEDLDEEVEDEQDSEESEESEDEEFTLLIQEKDNEIAQLKAELESLKEYKAQKIGEEKNAMIELYADRLSNEELEDFKNKIDSYESALDLKKDIALCLLDKTMEKKESEFSFVRNSEDKEYSGADAIVAKYIRNKNQ